MNINTQTDGAVGRDQIIRALRALSPARALEPHEARSVAERQALRMATLLDLTGPVADLDAVASLPRLFLRTQAGMPVSGFSEWSRGHWVVAINEDDHWTRQRFTLAHELKHIIDNTFIEVLYPDRHGKQSHRRAEEICDYFAACLLMPRPAVKAAWAAGNQRVDDLAAHFGVSRGAMGTRLHQLGLTSTRGRCRHIPRPRYERAPIRPSFSLAPAQGSTAWT